jgi:hypothetical protein
MPDTTERPRDPAESGQRRWAWFILFYAAGLAVTAGVTYGLKAVMDWAAGA